MMSTRRLRPVAFVATLLTALTALVWVGASPVSAAPSLGVTASSTPSVLAGESIEYTVGVANTGDQVEYNVSITARLAPDVVYDGGSTIPTEYGNPRAVTDSLTGYTTLIWSNISDVQVGDSLDLNFTATPRTAMPPAVFVTYPVGANVAFNAAAYANTDPRFVPRFTPAGVAIPASYTQSGSAASTPTQITAITIDKSEPSPEGELLRGVHDQTTVYTLDVNVTDEAAVNGVVVTDMIPAALEFLGCGAVDNSAGPEFTGAPSLTGTPAISPATCLTPTSVSTVANPGPDGALSYPAGVYTRVVWNLGNRPAGSHVVIQYAAAIPLQANTLDFEGPTPSIGAPFLQASNLDNNNGASTREPLLESSLTNRSRVSGLYQGPLQPSTPAAVSDTATETVTVEDFRIRKSVTPAQFSAGGVATYSVIVDSSEYTSISGAVLSDTIGNGLCPLDNVDNYTPGDVAECAPLAPGPTVSDGVTTTPLPYTSVVQLPGGGFDMTFSALPAMAASSTLTVTYQARMRSQYENGPIDGRPTVAGDSFTNDVDGVATSTPIPNTGETGTAAVRDGSSAGQATSGQSINKRVKPRAVGEACNVNTAAYADPTEPLNLSQFGFRLGDSVCFRLTVSYASGVFNKNPVVTDFLPPGVTYTDGSMVALGTNNAAFTFNEASAAADTANPTWLVGTVVGSDRYVDPGGVFDVVLAGTVNSIPDDGTFDLTGNLMKMVVENTAGATSSFRDEVPFALVPAVPLTVDKTVAAVSTPVYTGTPVVPTPTIQAGSVASYEIDVTHAGAASNGTDYSVRGLQVFDILPQPVRCAHVSAMSNPAFVRCYDNGTPGHPTIAADTTRSVIVWNFVVDPLNVDAEAITLGNTKTLTYDVTWPNGIGPEVTFTNTAGVRSYQAFTQVPGAGSTYYPESNIDAAVPAASWNAEPASDTASVRTRDVTVAKTFTSPILPGNTGPFPTPGTTGGQAVVGEVVTYNYSVTIPAGTSVYGGRLTDVLPTGWSVAASPVASFTFEPNSVGAPGAFAAAPGGVSLNTVTGGLDLGATYTNATATDQRFTVTTAVVATGTGINQTTTSTNRVDTATFQAATVSGGPSTAINRTQARTVAVIQPTPTLTKSNNGGASVTGGQTVQFTLTAAQVGSRPTLYDSWVVDCIPAGLTYGSTVSMTTQVGAGAQVPATFTVLGPTAGPVDGCAAGTTRVGWQVDELAQNTTIRVVFSTTVNLTAVGGDTYTNTAALTGSSLDDNNRTDPSVPPNPLERVYTATATNPVTVSGSAATKTVDKATATIGETVTYTVTGPIAPNTNFYQAALVDTLPAGVNRSSVSLVSATCVYTASGLPCAGVSGSMWAPGTGAGGTVVFFYGDLTGDPLARTLRAQFSAVVSDVVANTRGAAPSNSVNVRWDPTNTADPTALPYTWVRSGASATRTFTVVEPLLVTAKTVSDPTPTLTDTFSYTVTLRNQGTNLSSAYNMVVVDDVPAGIVPGTISNGGSFNPLTREITWDATDLPGPLAPAATLTLTYTATFDDTTDVANRLLFGAAPLVNTVSNDDYDSLPTGGRNYAGDSAAANVTGEFPDVTLAKAVLSSPPAYIGAPVAWQLSGTNTGTGVASVVDVIDMLPPNWNYVTGSSSLTVGANPPVLTDPTVTGPSTARQLNWAVGALTPGRSFTILFEATPSAAVWTIPGVGASIPQTNRVNATVADITGAAGNADGTYAPPQASAATRIDAVDVRIVSTTPSTAVAGTNHTWTLNVSNIGPDVAVGPFTVVDEVPAGTAFVSAGGTGWSCTHDGSPTGGTVTCSRTAGSDTLTASGPGSSFPPIAMVVFVGSDTAAATVYTDDATVSSTTFDTNLANNADDASTTVVGRADVRVDKSHTGSGVAGTNATWTVTVDNLIGPSTSRGDIVTVDTLPAGVSFVSFSAVDPDLACGHDGAVEGGVITCTRTDDMLIGETDTFSFTTFTDRAQVADLTNTVTVTTTTTDPVTANNTDTDTLDVTTDADRAVSKSTIGIVEAGSSGQYQISVLNVGPSDAGAFTFVDTLPAGVTATGASSTASTWNCGTFPATGAVTCSFADGLVYDDSFSVTFDVTVDPGVTGTITNTVRLFAGATPDSNPANDFASVDNGVAVDTDLSILKTGPATVTAGNSISWSLTVTNNGPSDNVSTITVADTLPGEVSFVDVDDLGGEWVCVHDGSLTGGALSCTNANGLTSGEAQLLTVNATIRPDAGPATVSNTATVSSPTPDSNLSNNSSTAPFDVVDDVELTLSKSTTGANPVLAGESTEFEIVVSNAGPSTADNVTVTDVVPAGMTVTALTAPTGFTCTLATRTCAAASLAPGTSVTFTVFADVASGVADGTVLTNTASVTTTSPGDDPADNTGTADVTVKAEADLSIVKAHSGDPVRAGDVTTFTFTVSNDGPSDAVADVEIADVLPLGLVAVSASGPWDCTFGDPAAVSGQPVDCVYEVSGTPAPLPAGSAAADLTLIVDTSPALLPSTLTNTATVESPTFDPDLLNNSSSVDVTIVTETDLTITKTVDRSSAVIGETISWDVTVSNEGPSDAFDVTVTDQVPASITDVTVDGGTEWTCGVVDQDVSCVFDGLLVALDSASFTVSGVVSADSYPEIVNTVDVSTTTPEPDVADNTATETTPVSVQSDLGITKTHAGTPLVGGQVSYTITVVNNGATENTGPVTVTDTLPAGLTFVSASGAGWACELVATTVTCERAGTLAVDASASFTLVTDVGPSAWPEVTNVATVSSPHTDLNPDNNIATDVTPVTPLVDLSFTKSVGVISGGVAPWDLTVTNKGPNATVGVLEIVDTLPANLAFLSYSGANWTCQVAGQVVTCVNSSSLAVGASSTLTLLTSVLAAPGETITNTATLNGGGSSVTLDAGSSVTLLLLPQVEPGPGAPPAGPGPDLGRPIAVTGSDPISVLNLAMLLVAAGALLAMLSRRRRLGSPHSS